MNRIYQKECESSTEYSLPDYMGDVKKILSATARAIPSGKFITENSAEFSGIVSYEILYADSEGRLTRISTSSDYDVSKNIDSAVYSDSAVTSRIANLQIRLTGPRKLILKAMLIHNIEIQDTCELVCKGNAFDEGRSAETLESSIKVGNALYFSSGEREYSSEAEKLLSVNTEDVEIITTSGTVRIFESELTEAGVHVKGEIIVTSIIRSEEDSVFAVRKSIPFEETIAIEGITPDMTVLADAYLTSVNAGVSADADGSVISVNAVLEFTGKAGYNVEANVVTDAYLTNRDTNGEYENSSYLELVAMGMDEEEISVDVKREEIGLSDVRDILQLFGEVRAYSAKCQDGKANVSGEIMLLGIATEVNDKSCITYNPIKFAFPFSCNVNCDKVLSEKSEIALSLSIVDTESVLDTEYLHAKCKLKIAFSASEPKNIMRMTECNVVGDDEYENSTSKITVYYPEQNESLFGVAKKFHTTSAKIASDNKLSEEVFSDFNSKPSLAGVKKLIIR